MSQFDGHTGKPAARYFGHRNLAELPTPEVSRSMYRISSKSKNPNAKVKSVVRVESVAHGLVYVIRCAQNDSVWISKDGKPVYEVQLPDTLPQKKSDVEDAEESAVDAKPTGS